MNKWYMALSLTLSIGGSLAIIAYFLMKDYKLETFEDVKQKIFAQSSDVASEENHFNCCSFSGGLTEYDLKSIQPISKLEIEGIVESILLVSGLPKRFTLVESQDPDYASAIVRPLENGGFSREIHYNSSALGSIKSQSRNHWSVTSIFAHEIGHHLSGHTLQVGGSRPSTELEADQFSGHILATMGSSLADATSALQSIPYQPQSATHPSTTDRLVAITEGWHEGSSVIRANEPIQGQYEVYDDNVPKFGAGATIPKDKLLQSVNLQRVLEKHKFHFEYWRNANPDHPMSKKEWNDADKERWIRWYYIQKNNTPRPKIKDPMQLAPQ